MSFDAERRTPRIFEVHSGKITQRPVLCRYSMRLQAATVVQNLKMRKIMTRRQKRYERRCAKRQAKRLNFLASLDNFDLILNRNNLFYAADKAKKRVMWKGSVQSWSIHQLLETEKLFRDLQAGKDVRKGFSKFTLCERGKIRHISAVRFYERVVQKSLCQNVLYPAYSRSLIFDNSASQDNKGTLFATKRLTLHLKRFYKRFGAAGYALLIDFKSYFENVDHKALKSLYRRYFQNPRLLGLIDDFVDAYGEKGLGLGSETSQLHAITFPNEIDHKIVNFKNEKIYYGRYMDDSYVLAEKKETLKKILYKIKQLCKNLNITLSPKKTIIVPISNGIKWLKTKFYLLKNGKIIRKPCRDSIARQRRKLKKQIKLLKSGTLNLDAIKQSFESWAGSMKRRNARLSVWKMRQILWSVKL